MESGPRVELFVKVKNAQGLHTRPATTIVRLLQQRKSQVTFTLGGETINARSILGILMLAAAQNSQIFVVVEGADADETAALIEEAFLNGFGEELT